jgi:hypothetical protein
MRGTNRSMADGAPLELLSQDLDEENPGIDDADHYGDSHRRDRAQSVRAVQHRRHDLQLLHSEDLELIHSDIPRFVVLSELHDGPDSHQP